MALDRPAFEYVLALKKAKVKSGEGKRTGGACLRNRLMSTWTHMKRGLIGAAALTLGVFICGTVFGQTSSQSPAAHSDDKLEAISKKIDEQNRKIDLLSQEILKIEQQLANSRPGVMIGEGAPNYSPTPSASESAHAANDNS